MLVLTVGVKRKELVKMEKFFDWVITAIGMVILFGGGYILSWIFKDSFLMNIFLAWRM